jgi:hypothetical protein
MGKSNGMWFRLYTDFYRNLKVRRLKVESQVFFIYYLCLWKECNVTCNVAKNEGPAIDDVAFLLHMDVDSAQTAFAELKEAGLILENGSPKGWNERQFESDNVTERVNNWRKTRDNVTCNVADNVTSNVASGKVKRCISSRATETETELNTPLSPPRGEPLKATPKRENRAVEHDQAVAGAMPAAVARGAEFAEAFGAYCGERRDRRKYVTPRALALLLKDLAGYDAAVGVAALRDSVKNGYQGVFPEKHAARGGGGAGRGFGGGGEDAPVMRQWKRPPNNAKALYGGVEQ